MSVYDIVTEKICAELERGVVPWQKPWVGGDQAPANLISKRAYTGINPLLLSLSGYSSPYWLTYKQAAELGGTVRKGEKSSLVVFYAKLQSKTRTLENGDPDTFAMLRYYNLFNVTQCDGIEGHIPAVPTRTIEPLDAAEAILEGYADKPAIDDHVSAAWYRPSLDLIGIPPRDTFTSADGYYSTLFHECIHSTGHVSRLDRQAVTGGKANHGSETYSREELIAELGAAFLCADAGIENTIPQSAAYCASWLKALKGDSKLIISAASGASKAARYITGTA
jgi:antirestriction protein ArdC|tara:strand:+ start:499 stop:1338 length:840 start_codon:yes stop_codon:yes gene_type:complete